MEGNVQGVSVESIEIMWCEHTEIFNPILYFFDTDNYTLYVN